MDHWSKAIATLGKVGEVITRTAQSAQELLRDQELRNKGIQTVITGAQTRLQGIQNGIVLGAGRAVERLQDNRRRLLSLLQNLEERLNASQRAWQLQARKKDKVDVQFGRQLIADAPQEVRARLWYVLLENPHLAAPLKCQCPEPVPNRQSDGDDEGHSDAQLALEGPSGHRTPSRTHGSVSGAMNDPGPGPSALSHAASASSSSGGGRLAAAAAALGFGRSITGGSFARSPSASSLGGVARRERSGAQTAGGGGGSAAGGSLRPETPQLLDLQLQTLGQGGQVETGAASPAASALAATAPPRTSRLARAMDLADAGDSDGWELVTGVLGPAEAAGLASGAAGAGGPLAVALPEAVRLIMEHLEALGPQPLDESGSDPVLVAQQAVLEAMLQVPWEANVGLPPAVAPDSRFALLNEMTAGQEEVDDSILRDIHRTFPEHPYFSMEAGQRALFKVLKAYSLHDLEVAYCQGMAFMVGVLLMYVPEEIAFRLFCRLMDPEGPNLRRLYLPGLEPLKAELATFELLLTWRLPELAAHLTEFGLPPVLYVSQWLMTLFATPFPPAFCARMIDILLQDGNDRLLLRCSYAVIEVLEPELLARHDFEALITYLKMEPVSWGLSRQRAIMDRALMSPLTDAEIEVARDTIANRHFLASNTSAAAAAAAGAPVSAALAAAVGPEAAAADVQDLLGPAVSVPSPTGLEPRRSLEHEVEAALAMAAALTAGTAAVGGGGGCYGGTEREGDGGCGDAGPSGWGPEAAVSQRCRAGGEAAAVDGLVAGVSAVSFVGSGTHQRRRKPGHGNNGGGEGRKRSSSGGGAGQLTMTITEGDCSGPLSNSSAAAAAPAAAGVAAGTSAGSSGRHAAAVPGSASYGMSSSLLDELDLHSPATAALADGGLTSAGTTGKACVRQASEFEFGEYGEMLVDAGLLLPEVGTGGDRAAGAVPATGPGNITEGAATTAAGAVHGAIDGLIGFLGLRPGAGEDDGGFGTFVRAPQPPQPHPPLDGLAALTLGSSPPQQHPPQGTDLLLD